MAQRQVNQIPGVHDGLGFADRLLCLGNEQWLPGGGYLDGSKARDPLNTDDARNLRTGMLLGHITTGNKLAPSVIGVLSAAYDPDGSNPTQMTVSAATAVELNRRIGSSGTFKMTGPPAASGTVQTSTITYSAVNVTTGVVTITALSADVDEVQTITPTVEGAANEVQTITPSVGTNADCVQTITIGGTHTGGTLKLGFRPLGDPTGAIRWTDTIAWSAAESTMSTSVQDALDDLLGANVVVCSEIADTAATVLVLTFSGTGATNTVQGQVSVDVSAYTGASTVAVVMTTAGAGTISAGTYRLKITDLNQAVQVTPPIAWNANAAAINTAITDALGAGSLVVATGGPMSTPTAVVLTYSGTGYASAPQTLVEADYSHLYGCDDLSVVRTTAGKGVIITGTWRIGIIDPNGAMQWTDPIAHNANAAAINTALDAALGATLVVATGGPMSGPTAVVLTFSGAGYAALAQTLAVVDVNDLSGCGSTTVTQTTAGVTATGNDFIAGSYVQPTDGSETPITFVPDSTGIWTQDETDTDVTAIQFPKYLIGGIIDSSQILNWPSDPSLRNWLMAQLNGGAAGTPAHGKFIFDHRSRT